MRRFSDFVKEPPAAYPTCSRMELAARLLREIEQPVGPHLQLVVTPLSSPSRVRSRHRGEPRGRYRKRIKSLSARDRAAWHGAFMEQSGRKRGQMTANPQRPETARLLAIRY